MKKGFTLIELLIVIAIILILIAIALPNFLEAQIRSKVAKAAGDERAIATAQEAYFIDHETYTDDAAWLGCVQLTTPIPYIKEAPLDPFGIHTNGGGSPEASPQGPWYPMGTGINPKTEKKCCKPNYPARPANLGGGLYSFANPPFREAYIIYSSGPIDQEAGGSTGGFPLEGEWRIYSPTNGTNSRGGIITTGGVALELPSLWNLRDTHI